jgi:hypothetical protein
VDGIQMMIARSLTLLNASETAANVRQRRDENSRTRIRKVDEDSSAARPSCIYQSQMHVTWAAGSGSV